MIDQNPRGYSKVVDQLVGHTMDKVLHFNSPVVQVDVTCEGVTITTANGTTYDSSYAILSLPLGVLQRQHASIFKNNPLPSDQVSALMKLNRGNFTKIFGQWEQPFWDINTKNFLASYKLPGHREYAYAEFHNLAHAEFLPGSNILFMAVVEPVSTFLENVGDEDAKGIVLEWIKSLYPNTTIPDPVDFHITRHGVDPLSYMAYVSIPVGFSDAEFATAFQPYAPSGCTHDPKVFFVGEAACRGFNGYTHGAYLSGRAGGFSVLERMGFGPAPEAVCNRPLRDNL